MNTLYIIGNGFDLHHELPTSYNDFEAHLKLYEKHLYDLLNNCISYPNGHENIWYQIEENLSYIDLEYLEELVREYIPSLGSDEYNSEESACYIESQTIVEQLTTCIRKELSNFIKEASKQSIDSKLFLNLPPEAIYLNFNYSLTLEKHYSINSSNILYIHGTIHDKENIVFGHSVEPETFPQEQQDSPPSEEMTEEEQALWDEEMLNQYIPFMDEAKDELHSYYQKSYKNSKSIIARHAEFFSNLSKVSSIIVLGHSISDVDIEYFKTIRSQTLTNCQWTVSYYNEEEKYGLKKALLDLQILPENITLIQMHEMIK